MNYIIKGYKQSAIQSLHCLTALKILIIMMTQNSQLLKKHFQKGFFLSMSSWANKGRKEG